MNGIQNYGKINYQTNFKSGRTMMWGDAVLDKAIRDFNRGRLVPVTKEQYIKLQMLEKDTLNKTLDTINNLDKAPIDYTQKVQQIINFLSSIKTP